MENLIIKILKKNKAGLTEHNLILKLQKKSFLPKTSHSDSLSIFQVHFILFNTLYKLREKLLKAKKGILDIHTLEIKLKDFKKGNKGISEYDPLAEYYLDISNLENTTKKDVEDLLDSFWKKYLAKDYKVDALKVLDLKEPVDYKTIKSKYKKLASKYHPDVGGDIKKIQILNQAMETLNNYYGK
ncbi:MAG: DNA-J related domain-containing protein [Fusobacteriota bacterium]